MQANLFCKHDEYANMGGIKVTTEQMAAGRRTDPNYSQVSGYLPKDLVIRFKVTCTQKELSQTDALEQAIDVWLQQNEKPSK